MMNTDCKAHAVADWCSTGTAQTPVGMYHTLKRYVDCSYTNIMYVLEMHLEVHSADVAIMTQT
jgi:hypothetical protein